MTYAGTTTVQRVATAAVNTNQDSVATLTSDTTDRKEATFNIGCSENGRFVYHVSRLFAYNTTACSLSIEEISNWIGQSSIDGLRVDETYYECEDILGMANIATPNSTQILTIPNLMASTDYTIEGYCLEQIGRNSMLKKLSFSTDSNGGYVSTIDFEFES